MTCAKKRVLISDFDGTISKKDFFWYAVEELLKPEDIRPWDEYQAGRITHIEALSRIFSKIRLSEKEFQDFVLSLPIEECFVETAKYCHDNNIGYYIISAGADFYIKIILKHLNVESLVTLISNNSYYKPEAGLIIVKPEKTQEFYSEKYGVSKALAVDTIKKKYDFCIFAGDGGPDFEAAKLADKVFARERLLELCRINDVHANRFNTYSEILEYLKND